MGLAGRETKQEEESRLKREEENEKEREGDTSEPGNHYPASQTWGRTYRMKESKNSRDKT